MQPDHLRYVGHNAGHRCAAARGLKHNAMRSFSIVNSPEPCCGDVCSCFCSCGKFTSADYNNCMYYTCAAKYLPHIVFVPNRQFSFSYGSEAKLN